MDIFGRVGKPAIIAQKLQRAACDKLHMKPRHKGDEHATNTRDDVW